MSDEHRVAIVSFEGALKREIKRIRDKIKKTEKMNAFKLTITASGRVNDGDVKLVFSLATDEYGSDAVKGRELNAVVDEQLRQLGWKEVNAPIAIGYEKIPSDDLDPQF